MGLPVDRPDHAAELRHELVDVRAVCTALDLKPSREERGKWHCPRHGGSSLSVRLGSDRTLQARCFGCDFAGDVFALVAEVHRLDTRRDFPKVLAEAARMAHRWDVLEELEGRGAPRTAAPPPKRLVVETPEPERTYPAEGELETLWAACGFTACDGEVRELLESRGLVAELVDDAGLARALPLGVSLPRWARYQGRTWLETGHRLVCPVYDATGTMRSVRAWRVTENDTPKRLPPSGHKAAGLVLADPFAVAMLAAGKVLEGMPDPLRVIVAEGEPDFLTWATRFSDANEDAPLVLAIAGAGSWSKAVADRIPDGARVTVWTDHDDAGNAYAEAVRASLSPRCKVLRAKGTA